MKFNHSTDDVNVNVEIPTEDLKGLLNQAADLTIKVICVYMAADVVRHILKGE